LRDPPSNGSSALTERERALAPARLGAEFVHLAEELYVRLARVGFAILLVGCGLALLFATLEHGAPGFATSLFVGVAALLGVAGIARTARVYLWLRSRRLLEIAPAALGAVAVLLDGPDSPCWWIALPLLWIVAAVSSTSLAVGAAVVTAVAFLAGTLMGGQALMGPQDIGVLPAAVGLPAYTLIGRVLVDGFAALVLGRHRFIAEEQDNPGPLRVANLDPAVVAETAREPSRPAAPQSRRSASRLTARQLEVTLLLRDGLRQTEIAACLGISVRQVERLIGAARERAGAATTSELVAMLAGGALAHPTAR
jgi:DNA-binding CsgD family transcriptional regulator